MFVLLFLILEIEEKEVKMQQLYRQIEMKNMEVQRFKMAADAAKVIASTFVKSSNSKFKN
jgi:hypothetical protein